MSSSIIGFTGTQKGMTSDQKKKVEELLAELDPWEVHHGDCIGSDEEFHRIAFRLGISICIHPPINPSKRAFCKGANETFNQMGYLDRNKRIVDHCDLLLATPKECEEQSIIVYPEEATDGW